MLENFSFFGLSDLHKIQTDMTLCRKVNKQLFRSHLL